MASILLLAGCYTAARPGLSLFKLDYYASSNTTVVTEGPVIGLEGNISYLSTNSDGSLLLAALEKSKPDSNVVTLLRASPNRNGFRNLGSYGSGSPVPHYISIDNKDHFVFLAHYFEGIASVSKLDYSRSKLEGFEIIQYKYASNVVKSRQEAPHTHCVKTSPNNRYVYVVDLGGDRIYRHSLDPIFGPFPEPEQHDETFPGSGPRHIVFHPSGGFAYVVAELSNQVLVFDVNLSTGGLTMVQVVPTLPPSFANRRSIAGHIAISPNGRFLYASNRGQPEPGTAEADDTIAMYSVGEDGRLRPNGFQQTFGKSPRIFAIDPSSQLLAAGNEFSDNIIIFKISSDGRLQQTGPQLKCVRPKGLVLVNSSNNLHVMSHYLCRLGYQAWILLIALVLNLRSL